MCHHNRDDSSLQQNRKITRHNYQARRDNTIATTGHNDAKNRKPDVKKLVFD